MSYDICLFNPKVGAEDGEDDEDGDDDDIEEAFERANEADMKRSPADPERERWKRELARAIIAKYPELSAEDSLEEPNVKKKGKLKRAEIELNDDEDGDGLQILITDHVIAVSVPYWHGGEKAGPVAKRLWDLLKFLKRKTGYQIYDQQVGSIDLSKKGDLKKLAQGIGFEPEF